MSQLKQSLKLPGASKIRGKTPADPPSSSSIKPITSIDAKVLESVLAKGSSFVDLSTPAYNLESDDFLLHCPNVIKELDLSYNSLVQLHSLKNLNKLKRLFVDNNEALVSMQFQGLANLVLLSAINNRIVTIEDTSDLKKLVHLDLCGNRIFHGFDELGKLKTLRVLDLASNTIDMPIQNFVAYVLEPLKRLPKLEYLSFIDNPVETKIPEFRSFIIQELPKLKYLDWLPITKEEKTKAAKFESDGVWIAKTLPTTATPSPRVGAVTHNANYNKDILEAVQNSEANGGNSLPAEKKPEVTEAPTVSATPIVEKPTSVSNFRGMTTSASTPSPVQRRAAPVRESSQFNDFSALDAMIEEFEGASHELGMSRSISSPGGSHSTSMNESYRPSPSTQNSIGNISNISSPIAPSVKSSEEDPLAELLTEFESITPVSSSHNLSSATPMRGAGVNSVVSPIQHPTDEQFNEALASTDVHYPDNSYEKYAEDAQILSNIDKAIEATPGADKNRQKKFATNVVRSDFPDAYFADELEAALSELEASLDFPEMESTQDNHKSNANGSAAASQNNTRTDFNLTSISEIESTLQELASTTSTPSKSDISADTNYSSPYSTPTHNNTSRSSPYTAFSSSSNRTNTPLPNQAKPAAPRVLPEPKASPKLNVPTSPLKKPAPPKLTPPSNNSSFSHSFAAAFDSSSPVSPTSSALVPDSPKIRSKPGQEPVVEQPQANEEDVLDDLINSLALETPVQEEPQVPTMLRARRPQSAMFVQPIYQPQLATLPPAQLPPSIIKNQELQQQQQALLQQQERDRKLHEEKERRMQEEHEQQQLAMKRQLNLQQQQMEQLQQQQLLRERTLNEERERERVHREQLAQREQLLQRELLQQKELQFQQQMQLQTELRKKEMEAEMLLQQQKHQTMLMQQQAFVQQQQQAELAIRKVQQEEQRDRLVNTTGQIVPYNYLTITDKIGAGSFGDVHNCVMRYPPTANLAPKDVTVKKIRMQRFNDNFLDQFSKEVQSFTSLSAHPNVLPLIGGCVEVVICTIHDYVSGSSLAETKGISELGSNLTLQIARSIVAGLQELHRIGKMHRSLKPSNVMLANPDETNPLRTVKLRDYGFTSIKDAILKAGQAPSPYLAPEILTSGSPPTYNQAVDTYSFGMTLWYIFSGEQPFLGLHPKKMAESVSTGVRPNIPPHTPLALAKLIAACWNTDPGSRPPLDTVARILSMSEAKLFAGAAPIANPSLPPPEPIQSQPPPPQPTYTQPTTPPITQPAPPIQQQRPPQQDAAQGNRIGTVLSRVVDTLISKSANQIPKACRLLEVINQPEVIPVMIEKAIPGYLVDMLKNNQLDSTDIEAILRTLLILSDHEVFAQALSTPDMIAPILALVRPHTAVTTVSRSSYVVKNTYVLPAARVVHAVIAHPRLLIALRDRPEMETLIAFTDSLKELQNLAINQSNDDTAVHILGVINQLLTTPKSRAYFVSTSGLDAALYHANSSYAPLRAQAVEVAFLFAVNLPSPPNVYQDSFARNPAAVIGLISCISSANDTSQLRGHAAKVLNMLAQLSWQAPTAPLGGSSRISGSSRLGGTHAAVTASLQAAVPRLISTLGNCRAGDNDELVVDICRAISSILDNPNLNASASISKLDQLAIFAQLQNIPPTSPILQPILFLANHIVHLRDDTANLHGELAMCVPQLISIAFSPSSLPDVQSQALDFIAHISTDGQHAATLVEAGVVRSAMHQLTTAEVQKSDSASAFSFQILASILGALFQSQSPLFAEVCASIVAGGGIGLISRLVKSGSSSQSDVCEWAVATLSELSRDETTRESIVSSGTLSLLGTVSTSAEASSRLVEGSLACFSSFCPFPKYYPTLRDSQAIAAIAARLSSGDNLVALSLKCVLQLVKEASGRQLLIAHNVPSLLEALASSQSGNPTLPLAAKRVLGLLKA